MVGTNDTGAEDRLSAYLDEQLAPDEAEAFENYLAGSPEARRELDELRRVVALVSTLPAVEAPPDFLDKVTRKAKRQGMWTPEGMVQTMVSLPFQVLSILVILAIAVLYMMVQLESDPTGRLERDPKPPVAPRQ